MPWVSGRRLLRRAGLSEAEASGRHPVRWRTRRAARRIATTVLSGRPLPGRPPDVVRVLAAHLQLHPVQLHPAASQRPGGGRQPAAGSGLDPGEAERVRAALTLLTGPQADPRDRQEIVDVLAGCWRQTRHPDLLALVRRAVSAGDAAGPAGTGDPGGTGRRVMPDPQAAGNVPLLLLLGQGRREADALAARHPEALVGALDDPDAEVRSAAAGVVRACVVPAVVESLGRAWLAAGDQRHAALLADHPLLPRAAEARLCVAALKHRDDVVAEYGPDAVDMLLGHLERGHPPGLAGAARRALRSLTDPAAREQVCAEAIRGRPEAVAAVMDRGWLPAADPDRALLLFLTAQWDRYERLDFDGRLIGVAYAAADEQIRERLREAARASGRADVLRMMLGGDRRARARVLSEPEADYLVDTLIGSGRLDDVWRLLFELTFDRALAAAGRLDQAGFTPGQPDDAELFRTLVLAGRRHDPGQVRRQCDALPWALQVATARVRGQAGGVSFAPDAPHLAIASNSRQVGLWDLAAGRLLWRQTGFARSVGAVLHAGEGRIYAAERSQGLGWPCGVYLVEADGRRRLGEHDGPVTAMLPHPGGGVLTASRDGTIATWGPDGERGERLVVGDDWPRAAALSPDGSRLAVAQHGLALYDPASGRLLALVPTGWVPSAAAFSPDGAHVLLGGQQGQMYQVPRPAPNSPAGPAAGAAGLPPISVLTRWWQKQEQARPEDIRLPFSYGPPVKAWPAVPPDPEARAGRVVGIAALSGPAAVVTAGGEGTLAARAWPSHRPLWHTRTEPRPDGWPRRIVSMTVSGNGAFLAAGHPAGETSLWDLRPHRVRELLRRPLAEAVPADLGPLDTLADRLPVAATVAAALRHRFRHDIHLDDPPAAAIRAGRHDIELG